MGGSRSRPSRPVELEESPTSRSFTRQVPFNDEEPASPSSPPWTPLGPVSPGTGSLSLGGRQFFGRSSGPSSPEPSPLSPKSQSSKSSRPFLARSWSALSLGGKKDEPQELTEFLRQVPLLKCLPRAKVSLLTEVASVQKFAPGSDVVRQGEEGSSFFIIRSGSAVVVKENEEDEEEEEEELLVLKKGDFFGERSLLTDELRSATVRADTQLVVLEVTREQFDRLGLREELDFHGRKSLLVTHLVNAQTPAEKTREDLKFIRDSVARNENLSNILDVRQMPHFADPAWKEEVQVGQNVIEEGDVNADFFYVVRSGEFQILIDGSVTGTLGRGDCFGELSLICSAPRTATVRATAISTLWVLPRGWLKSAAEESARLASKLSMVYLNQVRTLDVLLQAEKEMLAPLLAKVVFKKNDSILRFGEEETSMYILAEGTVRVEDDKVVELEAYLTENQQHLVVHTFGERALIGDGFNSDMSVKISSPEATCYRLDGVDFISMLGSIEEILQQSRRGLDFQGLDTDAPMNTSRLVQFRKKDLQRVSFLRAGQFGNLELWCHTLTGVQYMVKAVSKGYIMEQGLQKKIIQERDIMMMLDSSFTISLFQTFTGEQMLYFLMETALGGDLYTAYLKNALHGSQRHAVFYSALVVLALEHLHGKKVAYRDLKPENVLLSSTGYVKLVDFSLAKVVIGRTYTIVGTPEYLAPEMIGVSGHNQAVDWWALGIFIFELLSGQTPFEGSNPMQTFGKTMAGVEKVTFSSKVSSGARRLIEGLLKRSPAFRLAMKKGGVQNVKDADWYGDVDWSLLARSMTEDMRKLQMQAEDAPLKGLSMETANFHSHEQRKAPFVPFEDDGSGWAEAFASWNMKSENVEF